MGASVKLSRASRALGERSFKGADLPEGTIININEVVEKDLVGANGNTLIGDIVKCTINNTAYNMPLSEFMKFQTEDGTQLISATEGDNGQMPEKLEIKSATHRVRKDNGELMYTAASYHGFDKQVKIHGTDFASFDWEAVYKSELKSEPRAIKDYVVIEVV